MNKPEQLEEIDLSGLKAICQSYIDAIAEDGYAYDEYHDYIFETAMETLFGGKVWDFINNNREKAK